MSTCIKYAYIHITIITIIIIIIIIIHINIIYRYIMIYDSCSLCRVPSRTGFSLSGPAWSWGADLQQEPEREMRQLPRERADQAWGSCFGAPIVEDENSKVEDLVEQNKVSFSVETPIKKGMVSSGGIWYPEICLHGDGQGWESFKVVMWREHFWPMLAWSEWAWRTGASWSKLGGWLPSCIASFEW